MLNSCGAYFFCVCVETIIYIFFSGFFESILKSFDQFNVSMLNNSIHFIKT